jgi:hypothetical protein
MGSRWCDRPRAACPCVRPVALAAIPKTASDARACSSHTRPRSSSSPLVTGPASSPSSGFAHVRANQFFAVRSRPASEREIPQILSRVPQRRDLKGLAVEEFALGVTPSSCQISSNPPAGRANRISFCCPAAAPPRRLDMTGSRLTAVARAASPTIMSDAGACSSQLVPARRRPRLFTFLRVCASSRESIYRRALATRVRARNPADFIARAPAKIPHAPCCGRVCAGYNAVLMSDFEQSANASC